MKKYSKMACVILAGGKSSRMGQDNKCLLKIEKKTILNHIIDNINDQFNKIVLNINKDLKKFEEYDLEIISDSIFDSGPLSGILASLDWGYENGYDFVFTVPSDVPFFPKNLANNFLENLIKNDNDIIIAANYCQFRKKIIYHPTFGIWKTNLREDLRTTLLSGTKKIFLWAEKHNFKIIDFEDENELYFFNINTIDDLKKVNQIKSGKK
tara:strand:- start:1447 stop:2076 length:630 start_codon:yes stop_codon:yes gene_type:complete